MSYIIISVVAFVASGVTLFSGFGLGTVLLPAFAVFFPIDIAISFTAIVHLLNNLFRLVLVAKNASPGVIIRFGIPAVLASFLGAQVLLWLGAQQTLFSYGLMGRTLKVTPMNLIIAILILFFALWEALPALQRISLGKKYLPAGGVLSGFFGGLSGHQGPFRSAFLLKAGLSEQGYIATGAVVAVMVDMARLYVYVNHFTQTGVGLEAPLLAAATLSGFAGAILASRFLKKITMRALQLLVAVLMFIIGVGLGMGVI